MTKVEKPVFELAHVGVRFERHAVRSRSLKQTIGSMLGGNGRDYFHALSDINVTIHRGEQVGIIGRNGAGKSTLLRVLAQVVSPQNGWIGVRNDLHIVPLLELGIGFQPDLSGRENCLLAGLLIGFSAREMRQRMDGIIKFSELGDFFDEPVKNYSSGMYARLAFALATDVEPDVLLVDEVLGVGDEFFMRKCIVRMQRLIATGRTTVFVSHNLDFLITQCERLIWLEEGKVILDGQPASVAAAYRQKQNRGSHE